MYLNLYLEIDLQSRDKKTRHVGNLGKMYQQQQLREGWRRSVVALGVTEETSNRKTLTLTAWEQIHYEVFQRQMHHHQM